ncbi:DHA3 family tetracycline resistance protein-like MFS transporter [Branchiibius hedensis]|uniref:MFS transporter, DHA3 family, tetracycline resistance protein n=1 Tax=Branchiibius hedensis TaxID=672460 RepID=A0A2Y9BLJ2_9MICO|nr:MFS transporter [Branchiibius hedensis]PWJ23308.1 DHA3 family tetracycline resistance protein-like MFS transporter [Branchiibius hedensis]SSA58997.1 MFS transporter, DHA3 family, tetracycline resistance protein [Branchiibius hedensis]
MLSSYIGRRPISARTAYLWWEGSWSLLQTIAFTLTLLYQVQVAHLSPAQLVLVGACLEASCFLFEVPTSIVADVYSRRLSALIGAVIVGVGILIQGAMPSFVPILAAQVVWGLGFTFISGAVDAWITDEVGADAVQPLFTRFQQQHLALNFVGIIAAGLLARIDLRVPMLVAGAGYVLLAIVMAPLLPETGFNRTPASDRSTWAQMTETFHTGLAAARRPGIVRSFAIIAVITGASSEVFDRLWTAHIINAFTLPGTGGASAATWFTVFALIGALISLATSLLANRFVAERINAVHPRTLLALLALIQAGGVIGFAMVGSLWPALSSMWIRDAARNLLYPVQAAWLNRNIESTARSTTLSMTSQADALGQVVGGPILGAVASRASIPVAMTIAGLLMAPVAAIYHRIRPMPATGATSRHLA